MGSGYDYYISCCSYSSGHISSAGVHENLHGSLGSKVIRSRSWIVGRIKAMYSFCTIVRTAGRWRKGAKVNVITVGGNLYLRTDANRTKRDNLGELPEC
ncbi:MAG: DUF3892 domain-containing protein [Candidatus Coatesbacteria bacterium]|nr:DUF3892 domain-containing protein [Candidatus Coatesbacteria bacterium]